jgi:hypothetical protein
MSELAGSGARNTFFFSFATPDVASEDEEAAAPRITSTCSVSYQRPAMATATSALFCTSAWITSIFLPRTVPPKSSTAICVATTAPGPLMSA